MSNRNSQAAKSSARERIRAERERQKKRDRTRRQLVVGASVAGGLAVAGAVGFGIVKLTEPTGWEAAAQAPLVKPAHTQGKNGTEILIGDPKAKETLEVFEDVRCPSCASFERTTGDELLKNVKDGRFRVRFTMYTFIDGMAGGEGSKNALSALGAALNVSPEAFLKYKSALYSEKYHPDEREDLYAKDSELLKAAAEVPELKNNAAFEKAVRNGTYDRWTMDMTALFGRKGVEGTPTFLHGDKKLVMDEIPRRRMTRAEYRELAVRNFRKMLDKEFGPAKGTGAGKDAEREPGKGSGTGGEKGIREGEKDPSGAH
ncbi:DSBA oxidoreductase family protein [Streptomyces sp. NBRC 110611]|uniref:thioredoxin domain-containing protein n=1 Tax=Streptomyces sp. NBRC 110611 TaxID=1621259 RepID=UPI0008338ABB|nr:thioredoxin domain-containing protein [Streptomyces sp. NBRC 110611]GAU68280.1 DSBA oxidoreductase family protein [Streptomyces sp. NBRC 110611]